MVVTVTSVMGWDGMGCFTGLLKPYMTSKVSGLEADYQLHQIGFLLALVMTTVVAGALNFDCMLRIRSRLWHGYKRIF